MDQNFKIKNIFIENRKSNLPFDFWVYSDILPILLTPTNKCIYIEYMYTYYHKVKLDSIPSSFVFVTSDTETITIAIFTKYMQSPFLRYPPPFFFIHWNYGKIVHVSLEMKYVFLTQKYMYRVASFYIHVNKYITSNSYTKKINHIHVPL